MFWEGFEDMFCPKCKVLMYPKEGVFTCIKCGFEVIKTFTDALDNFSEIVKNKLKEEEANKDKYLTNNMVENI